VVSALCGVAGIVGGASWHRGAARWAASGGGKAGSAVGMWWVIMAASGVGSARGQHGGAVRWCRGRAVWWSEVVSVVGGKAMQVRRSAGR